MSNLELILFILNVQTTYQHPELQDLKLQHSELNKQLTAAEQKMVNLTSTLSSIDLQAVSTNTNKLQAECNTLNNIAITYNKNKQSGAYKTAFDALMVKVKEYNTANQIQGNKQKEFDKITKEINQCSDDIKRLKTVILMVEGRLLAYNKK